ncbi:aspartic proteinase CDR1-like [Tripterygium wilfordii]|uniref:aspartic proteinase CDR1-like n=1 Tax=Tripterygium wilfordii TaxID=458696 RepID=UPI0018F8264F|nr:aspartic proteinase CDR1-like [Tripterygium wilfordii]
MHHLILISLLILFNAFILYPIEAEMNSVSFDLIHHDSKVSPFYNSSMTESEVSLKAVMRSLNRLNHFNSSMSIDAKYVESQLTVGDYFMIFAISDQTTTRIAIPDMLSDLIWVRCVQKEDPSRYNPKSSKTYDAISYGSKDCDALQHPEKGQSNVCRYKNQQHSIDGFSSSGVLGTKTFYFKFPDGKHKKFSKIVFGCDDVYKHKMKEVVEGVIGLGQGSLSLVSQFGNRYTKFSYCLREKSIQTPSKIKIRVRQPYYYLNLEDISINGKTINLSTTDHLSMAVDIQTAHTSLPPLLYAQVIAMFKAEANGIFSVEVPNYGTCFLRSDIKALNNVPSIVFHFTKARLLTVAEFYVNPNTLLQEHNEYKCLTIVPKDGPSVLGNKAQVEVGPFDSLIYDVQSNNKMSMVLWRARSTLFVHLSKEYARFLYHIVFHGDKIWLFSSIYRGFFTIPALLGYGYLSTSRYCSVLVFGFIIPLLGFVIYKLLTRY